MASTENGTDKKVNEPDRQILKSTFIMGGSSVINTILGVVRTKIIALMIGPSGVGLTGIFMTIMNLMTTFSGMGVGESGVRQIAGAVGTGSHERISRTVITVRRTALLAGLVGLCILFAFSRSVSRLTFGNPDHVLDIALLSATVFFGTVSAGQTALIQGMRRIGDLAKVSVFGAFFGTVLSIPIIYFLGERGIVFFLIIVSATSFLTSWWYSSKIMSQPGMKISWKDSLSEAKPLLKLGLALMLGALMTVCTQYFLRVFVVRHHGLEAAGMYHASTTMSLMYVGVILNAMLTDYYPRLSAVAHDHDECRSLINKQVEVGLLLALPGILGIMTFAALVISIFYSSKFMPAVDILRWQILGVVLQVVTWPMGFMLRAKGDGKLFFWTEFFANSTHLGFAWVGISLFGLPGIGMAFFGMNICYCILIFWIIRTYYRFSFSAENLRLFAIFAFAAGVVFLTHYVLPKIPYLLINSGITVAAGLYSIKKLTGGDSEMIPGFLLKIKTRFGLT